MRFVGFSARRHHENKTRGFLVFRPKNQKTQCKTKKKSSRNQKIRSQILVFWVFWFRVVWLSRKIVGSSFAKQMAVCVSVLIEKQSFLCWEPENVPKHR